MPHGETIQVAAQWAISNGYWIMFLAMLVEGPIITAAGAFAAALGAFNIWIVLLLSIVGNLVPDVIYYAIGYWGRQELIDKYGHYFRLSKERITQIEDMAKNHAWKALSLIKLTSVLATPGLIIVGAVRMPIKKYTWICLAITLPSSLFFLVIGYYFGGLYATIARDIHYAEYFALVAIPVFIVLFIFWGKISRWIVEKTKD